MARARLIKPDFFDDEKMTRQPLGARLFFIHLWQHADREGRLEDRPEKLATSAFPSMGNEQMQNRARKDCVGWLESLIEAGCVVRYVVNGRSYLLLPNFEKHQKIHVNEPKSLLPAPLESNGAQSTPIATNVAGSRSRSRNEAEAEAETEAEGSRARDDDPPSYPPLRERWENEVGVLPFVAIPSFKEHAAAVPKAWFDAAIDQTKAVEHPSWAYCDGILKNCRNEQRPPSSIRKPFSKTAQASRKPSLRYEVPA